MSLHTATSCMTIPYTMEPVRVYFLFPDDAAALGD